MENNGRFYLARTAPGDHVNNKIAQLWEAESGEFLTTLRVGPRTNDAHRIQRCDSGVDLYLNRRLRSQGVHDLNTVIYEHCGEFHFTTPFRVRLFFSQQRASAFLFPQALFWFKERCSARCQVQRKIPGQPRLDLQGISHAAKDSSRLIRDLTHLVFFHCNQRSASNS